MIPWLDNKPPQFVTESYVESPPAAIIVDETGAIWNLGMQEKSRYDVRRLHIEAAGFEFNVLRNGKWTGEWAAKLVRRDGKIRIFGDYGKSRWKTWNGKSFV